MKKNIIVIVFLLMVTSIMNVEAYTINVTPKENAVQTKYGYKSQQQTVSGTSCDGNINIFCIDHGLANQKTFNNCTISDVTNSVYSQVGGDFYTREYLYRVISDRVGLSKVNYNGTSVGNYEKYLTGNDLVIVRKASSVTTTNNTAIFSYVTNKISDTQYSVVITANIGSKGIPRNKFSVSSGNITEFSENNGIYTITVSVAVEKCKGANFKLYVDSATVTTSSTSGTRRYYAKCPNQNYIIEMSGACSISELTKNSTGKLEYEVSIDDETCQCKGEVGFSGECSDGSVSDKKTDFLSCVENGSFKKYCGRELKKTTNNGSGTTPVSSERTSNTTATLAGNDYCAVYCTEDINYDLPGVIETENGRYFKLKEGWDINDPDSGKNISITGKRTCYSSKINKDLFITNIKTKQQDIVDAVNNYLLDEAKNDAAENVTSTTKSKTSTCKVWNDPDDHSKGCKTWNTCSYTENVAKSSYQYKQYSIQSCSDSDGTCKAKSSTVGYYEYKWISDTGCSDVSNGKELQKKEPNASDINTTNGALNDTLDLYKSCFEWNNNYCFNPIIKFSYDEPYNNIMADELEKNGDNELVDKSEEYFTSVNSNYEGKNNGYDIDEPKTYLFGKTDSVSTISAKIDTTNKYVAKSVTEKVTYKDSTKEVYTYHPYGTIVETCPAGTEGKNCVKLGYVFPIALEHQNDTGIYNYYLHIYNVGVPGNDASCDDTTNFAEEGYGNGIMGDSSCSLFNSEGGGANEEEYTCQYMTKKCPECEVECVCPDGSTNCYVENKVCKYIVCPTCEVKCVGCLWNDGDTTISFKNISLDNVYEDDSTIGSNWTQEDVEKIEDKGQEIYEEKPMYSFTLTPQVMGQIREYNKKSNEGNTDSSSNNDSSTYSGTRKEIPKGGYNNDTLTCRIDETTNTAANCKSSFLRNYLDKDAINGTLPDKW